MFLMGAVAELAEQSLLTPEVRGLDPNVFKIICLFVNCLKEIKKQRQVWAYLKYSSSNWT